MSKYVATLLITLVLSAPAFAAERTREREHPRDPERIVKILKNFFGRLVALSPGLTEPKP
jgi:hypothetical protein